MLEGQAWWWWWYDVCVSTGLD